MKKVCKRWKFWGFMLGLMLFAAGFAMHSSTVDVQAATNGFRTVNGKTYYYRDGKKVVGLQKINNQYYYFASRTGEMLKGWFKSSTGNRRYFDRSTGQMKKGLRYVNGEYYYFDFNSGWAKSGFQKLNGTTRYYKPGTFAMAKGWMKNSKNQKWYFHPTNGIMYTGLQKINSRYYYFYSKTGAAQSGFIKFGTGTRYFQGNGNYSMITGWTTSTKGEKRYFNPSNGLMSTGKTKINGKWYYFSYRNGVAGGGWLVEGTNKRYFDRSTLVMVTGTKTIDGVTYTFASNGLLISSEEDNTSNDAIPTTPTSQRTIKNYLLNALQPVGRTLYIWGGGHNYSDATRKGISTKWTSFYNSQSSSYNYKSNGYNDLSEGNRSKGLDCSGYVGWATYQVMGTYSTVVSGEIGGTYKSRNWGPVYNQNYLSQTGYKLYPGDIGYDSGHTWIILGQCSDKSAVILHSTPNAGVQISGTPTPSGDYSSEAIALAKKYMQRFPGYQRMQSSNSSFYHTSSGAYVRRGNYFRWNNSVLADPEGYRYKTADQILADLFS